MSTTRMSLRSFLIHAKASLRTAINERQRVTLVIGNESADLDSLTCPILYSYIRSSAPPKQAFTPLYIPITNFRAADVNLRPEFLALLPYANLGPEHLITLDDLPDLDSIEQKLEPENTRWILVDHNALQGRLGAAYSGQVAGVIDHHDEENKVPKDTGCEPRIIGKTGSCTSFVTEYCREAWDQTSAARRSSNAKNAEGFDVINDASQTGLWDAQLATLAISSVLIDTTNLTAKQKTTEHDVKAVEYLEAKITAEDQKSQSYDRRTFFEEIDNAKKDIGSLKLHDILRKDYKDWNENGLHLGISSVVKPIGFLQEKATNEDGSDNKDLNRRFLESMEKFAASRKLDQYAIMTTSNSAGGQFQRELLLWAFTSRGIQSAKKFQAASGPQLELEAWQGEAGPLDNENDHSWRKVWWQRKVENSRKQVAPMLREALA